MTGGSKSFFEQVRYKEFRKLADAVAEKESAFGKVTVKYNGTNLYGDLTIEMGSVNYRDQYKKCVKYFLDECCS